MGWFCGLDIQTIPVSSEAREEYETEKALAFEEEHTPAAIIERLVAVAKRHCPDRAIPSKAALFKQNSHRVVISDLAVDRYLVGELQSMVTLSNGISNAFFQS
jgi:hypothetical protein